MAYPHNYGCSQLGDDHENTKKILRDMVLHPNAGAVLVVGLGCENNQPDVFREFLGEYDEDRVKFMVTQKVGDEYEEGMKLLRELYEKASKDERVDVPLSELRVGLKCGGFLRDHSQSAVGYVLRFPGGTRWYERIDGSSGNVRRRDHIDEPLPQQGII